MGTTKKRNVLPLTEKEVETIFDGLWDEGDITEDGKWELVDGDEWVSEGKYEHRNPIIKNLETGKFYQALLTRTGSYYSDYDYQYHDELVEVKQKQVTVTTWVGVYEGEEDVR